MFVEDCRNAPLDGLVIRGRRDPGHGHTADRHRGRAGVLDPETDIITFAGASPGGVRSVDMHQVPAAGPAR